MTEKKENQAVGLGARMAEGAVWTVMMRFCIRALGVISTMILARLLTPADYGLIALATVFAAAVELLGSFNFEVWLIRHPNPAREHYDTVWTLSVMRGSITALILWVAASPLSVFYNEPRLVDVVRIIAAGLLVSSFANIGIINFQRELRFDRDFVMNAVVKSGAFVVTVTLGFVLRSYWALAAGIVTGYVLQVLVSYRMHQFRPRFSLLCWREAFGFSKWLLAGSLLSFIRMRSDIFIIGKLVGGEVLGLYNVAKEIANLASSEIVTPIGRVLLPGYSKIQGDFDALRRSFLDSFGIIMLIGVPLAVGIALVADPLIRVMLGAKWVDAIPVMQALALNGVAVIGLANQWPTLVAIGRPGVASVLLTICILVLLPSMYVATSTYGAVGTALALGGANLLLFLMGLYVLNRFLKYGVRALWRNVWRTIIATALMSFAVSRVEALLAGIGFVPVLVLVCCVVVGAGVYVSSLYLLLRIAGVRGGPEHLAFAFLRSKLSERNPR